jgi:hypothetical protein
MRHFHPTTFHLMRECATLFCKTKIDPYLYLERFIEVNKSFFVENAQVKFATILLEADAAGGRDWDQYMRQMHAYWTGGQAGMTKEKSDISYSYNQAMKHIGNMLELVNQNPEADDPTVLRQVKNNLNKLKLSFDNVKPMIDNVRDRIMNVAVNKMQGVSAPLAGSVDFSQFSNLKDDQVFPKMADIISRNPAANTPEGKFLNMVKNNPLRFGDTAINDAKTQLQFVDERLAKKIIKDPRLIRANVMSSGANAGKIKIYRILKTDLLGTLAADIKSVLTKFFGDENAVLLAFLKFKNIMPQQNAPSRMEIDSAKIQENNANIDRIQSKLIPIITSLKARIPAITKLQDIVKYINDNNPPINDPANIINRVAVAMGSGANPVNLANSFKLVSDIINNYGNVPPANRKFFKAQNATFKGLYQALDNFNVALGGLPTP